MRLALEAQELWRSDPIYKAYYHESGMLYAEDKGMARVNLANLNAVGQKHHAEIWTSEETRNRFDGVFKEGNCDGVTETYFNPQSGWGEAHRALKSVIEAAVKEGVVYDDSSVSTLSIDNETCTRVRTEDGSELNADHVILCTGAWTPKLLLDTAPSKEELQVGERMIAAGAIQCSAMYAPDQMYKLRSVPVMFNGCDHTECLFQATGLFL
jgi:sarcosine oxidase/L-pipecolate oxidase